MLGFIYVPTPHRSEKLNDTLVECLMVWNIDKKIVYYHFGQL